MPLCKRSIVPVDISRKKVEKGVSEELEFVNNSTMAYIMLQLSSLSKLSEDLFSELHVEACSLFYRTCQVFNRVEQLKLKIVSLNPIAEEVSLRDVGQHQPFKSIVEKDQQIITNETRPQSIKEVYECIDPPPSLSLLDPYREDGKESMKFYTDPSYFFELWKHEIAKDAKNQIKKQKSKLKRRPTKEFDSPKGEIAKTNVTSSDLSQKTNFKKANDLRLNHPNEIIQTNQSGYFGNQHPDLINTTQSGNFNFKREIDRNMIGSQYHQQQGHNISKASNLNNTTGYMSEMKPGNYQTKQQAPGGLNSSEISGYGGSIVNESTSKEIGFHHLVHPPFNHQNFPHNLDHHQRPLPHQDLPLISSLPIDLSPHYQAHDTTFPSPPKFSYPSPNELFDDSSYFPSPPHLIPEDLASAEVNDVRQSLDRGGMVSSEREGFRFSEGVQDLLNMIEGSPSQNMEPVNKNISDDSKFGSSINKSPTNIPPPLKTSTSLSMSAKMSPPTGNIIIVSDHRMSFDCDVSPDHLNTSHQKIIRDTRSDLLDAIRKGIQLRKVEERRMISERRTTGRLDVQSIMEAAIELRRKVMEENDSEEEGVEDDGGWSDGD